MQDLESVPPVEPSDKKTRRKNIFAYTSFIFGLASIIFLPFLFKLLNGPLLLCGVPFSLISIFTGLFAIKSEKKMFAILGMVYAAPACLWITAVAGIFFSLFAE